jgi:ParB family chromosome partitioning protein
MKIKCPKCALEIEVLDNKAEKIKCLYCENITFLPQKQNLKDTKFCPFCKERIDKNALKCKYCGEFLEREPQEGGSVIGRFVNLFRGTIGGAFSGAEKNTLIHLPIDKIESNPFQPREVVDRKGLVDLTRSIKEYGVIVPIIVSKTETGYQLVAGQRRLLAAKDAGLKFIPAIVKTIGVREMMEMGYLENLHREDLNKIDRVGMFERICNEYPEIGRDNLANMLGLNLKELDKAKEILKLPIILQEALRAKMLTERHAFILKDLSDKDSLLKGIETVYKERLPVSETEEYVNSVLKRNPKYVCGPRSIHFHLPDCPYVNLIPREERQSFYSKKEAKLAGKIPCMMCM